ncbi:MAG: ABC transporter ATP-binding protein [Breznakia sp.]
MSIFKKLSWFFKKEWKDYVLGIGSLLMIAILSIIPPRIFGYIIDALIAQTLSAKALLQLLAIVFVLAIVMYALRYFWRIFILGASLRLERELRTSLFAHFTKMSANFFHEHRVGDLMAHATNDLKSIERVAGFGVLQLADSISLGVLVIISMLSIDVRLALYIFIPMPFMMGGAQILSKQIHRTFSVAQAAFSDMNNRMHESVSGIKVSKTFGQEKEEIAAFAKEVEGVYKKNMRVIAYDAAFDPLIIIILAACFTILFIIGGQQIDRGLLTIGDLVAFVSYMNMLIWPMLALGFLFNTVERGSVSYDRVQTLFKIPADIEDKENAYTHSPKGDIVIDIDQFCYPDTNDIALQNIHVKLTHKQTLGIVGKTGAGKTTLMKLLLREYENYKGSIYFGAHSSKDYTLWAYHKAIGYVPQDQFLFSQTIENNIRFANMEACRETVIEAAKLACVHDDIMGFENGYDTLVGERGVSLSGGQKQRIAIARALLLDPELLILDDSLSAVDAKTETKILHALKQNRSQKSTIIIAHRFSALKHAQEIIVLDDGQIRERGNHDELMAKGAWYADIFRQQELYSNEGENAYGSRNS